MFFHRAVEICLFLAIPAILWSQPDSLPRLRLIFAGDIMGHDSQIQAAEVEAGKLYDYGTCFEYVQPLLQDNDLAIGNLELTLPGEPPYQGYPQFRSPDELALALRYAGFNVLVTANNHSNDAGPQGLIATLNTLDDYHFLHTGTFRDTLERKVHYPLLIYRHQFKIALLNYTYGTNGIPTRGSTWVNRIDADQIREDLQEAKRLEPDFVLVILHWGKEYQTTENDAQRKLAKSIIRWGGDMIIGSHPHVVQPIRLESVSLPNGLQKKALVAYSLGNFISGQTKPNTDGGILLEVVLEKDPYQASTRLAKHHYIPCYRYRERDADGKRIFSVLPISPLLQGPYENLNLSSNVKADMQAYRNHVKAVMQGSDGKEKSLSIQAFQRLARKASTQ